MSIATRETSLKRNKGPLDEADSLSRDSKQRVRRVTNPLRDFLRRLGELSEKEIDAEIAFMEAGEVGQKEVDNAWRGWCLHRAELEKYLERMLTWKKFRRDQVVRALKAILTMEFSQWLAIWRLYQLRIKDQVEKNPIEVSWTVDTSPMQWNPKDVPRKRWRNRSPWNKESVDIRDDVYLK